MATSIYKKITVYHYMIAFLSFLGIFNMVYYKDYIFLPQLILAPLVAALFDIAVNYYKNKKLFFPQSAIISGLFIALILGQVAIWIPIFAAVIAMLAKRIVRHDERHIFNPASFGIISAALFFGSPAAWWSTATVLVLPLGLFIAYKIKRIENSITFLITFFVLNTIVTRQLPVLQSFFDYQLLFFAFFMAVEPKTTPFTKKGKIIFGIILGIFAFALSYVNLPTDLFLTALLVANLFTNKLNKL